MGLIRMIPGFLLFILGSIAMDIIQEESNSNLVFSFLIHGLYCQYKYCQHKQMHFEHIVIKVSYDYFSISISYTVRADRRCDASYFLSCPNGYDLFILGSIAMDIIQEESNSNLVFSFLTWINNHLFECVLLVFLIAVLIFLAGIFISAA